MRRNVETYSDPDGRPRYLVEAAVPVPAPAPAPRRHWLMRASALIVRLSRSYYSTLVMYPGSAVALLFIADREHLLWIRPAAGLMFAAFLIQLAVLAVVCPRRLSGRRYYRFGLPSAALAVLLDLALLGLLAGSWLIAPERTGSRWFFIAGVLFLALAVHEDWRMYRRFSRALRS